ncbi:cytochrome P450 2J6-like [Asterias rubens]|uniref:cytochrome P450 2J6-like n=1 Tax=Asterias rubens TaxID=7604 RepID=UPI001455B408|nr:cytochrome P450 2J6-like [Asterias rubens]
MLFESIARHCCSVFHFFDPSYLIAMDDSISVGFHTLLLFAVTFLLVLTAVRQYRRRPKNLPPGPWGLPIIGSLLSLGTNPHLTFLEMTKTYGKVFRMNLAGQRVVVVNGFEAVREALVKNASAFAGRPKMALFHELTEGQGIVTSDYGPVWREQRRFTLQTLRNFGFGKRSFETKITEEIHHMLAAFREKGSEAFQADHILEISASNVVSSLNFGRRFDYKDPQFQLLVDMIYRFSEIGTNAAAANFFPFLIKLPLPNIREMFHISDIIESFLMGIINQHKETYDPKAKRDFIDAYLGEIARRQQESPSDDATSASFTEKYLYHILNDLIFAGTETMSSTLRWALLYMIVFPDVQEKIQAELDSVLEKDQLPSIEDRQNLPYTEATLMEVQRMANITALPYPHKTTEDTELCGFSIPKDTPIYINLYSVHIDPTQWVEPEKFRPERFLGENGKVQNRPALMPFSAGRRACPGENLAKMELFLFFSSMLHAFKISAAPENPQPSIEKHYGISLNPSPFKICTTPR